MSDRLNIAQAEANIFYPAVTEEELSNDSLLIANYRRSLGRERLLWGAMIFVAGAWFITYLRGSK